MSAAATGLSVAAQDRVFRPHTVAGTSVEQLVAELAGTGYDPLVTPVGRAASEVRLTGAAMDPKAVGPGDLFVAVSGSRAHGADFVMTALECGAAAILTDVAGAEKVRERVGYRIPVIEVRRVREAAGPSAALIYGNTATSGPALFGVTGTNGKTTTTYFLRSLLDTLLAPHERATGLIGTIEIASGEARIPSKMTTPEAVQLHSLMALFREADVAAAAMEVSSHAISYDRVSGLFYAVAGFTNLTQDHLDLHGSMEEYFAAKAALFARRRTRSSVVIVDDPWGWRMAQTATGHVVTLATEETPDPAADWSVTQVSPHLLGSAFTLHNRHTGENIRSRTGLPGRFNVANAALAAVMVLTADESTALGVSREEIIAALEQADPFTISVPGRMQVIGTAPAAIVDFAHNPDAMIRTLEAAASTSEGKTILVIGAAGERDSAKRPLMGAIAVRMADHVIISDDDPHGEDPAQIRAGLLEGAREALATEDLDTTLEEISPRIDAIVRAVEVAAPEDTIILAGRGHEVHQDFAGTKHPIDDRVELARALRRRGFPTADDAPSTGPDPDTRQTHRTSTAEGGDQA
ncbi:UDP-N-acetylmuramoyl-L-alanyl-D-glutamate--2,6-diaminopimelate ligase [Nesterenkonia sp. E16_7]|uniref:UDP-N-acetylmuramyl-tripeptide synthetase n=1 Tax=unclassified Nesterenkonia TaxID=2629769 RepID=UPI001A92C921|nr:UDP-N-acetylmuramoyl-L-alanyl-D-glutamate--2,6-diaminopimelate ligase [Nesterenkonia sp. E16_10]MBO0598757.1 UDP-N-acetylmuramoyl-L-alanyl-D-glutamate--2,6-diaminopimelate ligase [Nesterenkonia sp. E16_7]